MESRSVLECIESGICFQHVGREVSIDDYLMMYRGHHSLIRYIPNKAARFGFKIYALAEATTGYVARFIFDEGESTKLSPSCPLFFVQAIQDRFDLCCTGKIRSIRC